MARLVQAADFQRVLGVPARERSTHFAVHYLKAGPSAARSRPPTALADKLSTDTPPSCPQLVDDSPAVAWFGWVVPKRHARRAVTRTLIKRQMREAVRRLHPDLPAGLWVVRLRQGFAVRDFPSAGSTALRVAARRELDGLMTRALRERS